MKGNLARTLVAATAILAGGAIVHAQIDPRTALLERGAWTALTAGQAHAAADAFREAIAADPKNARLHLGAGMAATLERRDADARDEFERALGLDPKLFEARVLLGQIQYRMGDPLSASRNPSAAACACPALSAVQAARSTSAARGSTCADSAAGSAATTARSRIRRAPFIAIRSS